MITMRKFIIFFIIFFIVGCGFSPIYKNTGQNLKLDDLNMKFEGDVSYDVREELENLISSNQSDAKYNILITAKEEFVPVIINTNGTVSKYQIDIKLLFKLIDTDNEVIFEDISVGFAQYDVLVSEIDNDDLRRQMLKSATNDAASLMITKIQSKLSLNNDS
tara:strand:- start:636 stop:1121 length:486 start_codon:yes stop_codon:yes gene_type:complete